VFGSVPAPSLRPRLATTHAVLIWRDFFFIFRYGGGESEVGFLLREKLTEFKCGLGFAKLFFWGFGFGKTETNLFCENPDLVSRPQEGSGEECGRGFGF